MIESDYLEGNYEIIQNLKQLPALRSFQEKELQRLLQISQIHEYNAGELILEEGNFDDWVYYLISGQAKIVKRGKELLVLRRTGDIFGKIGIITGSPKSASVYAKEDTVCLSIDIRRIDTLSKKDRDMFRYLLYRAFAEILANRLKVTTSELIEAREVIEKLMKRE